MSVVINTVWIGNTLGPVHSACLRSFVNLGHEVVLHAYGTPEDTPKGVKIFDASKLMREDEIVRHKKTRSLTLASDIYRYRLLKEGLGLYVDCDMYCLQPFENREYTLGWETNYQINNAVLGMPHDCELLTSIRIDSENPYFIPPWQKPIKRSLSIFRTALGFPRHVSTRGWGVIGPNLVTHHVNRLELASVVSGLHEFYPLHYAQLPMLYEPKLTIDDLVTKSTKALHLYNSALDLKAMKPGSPLDLIINS